VGDPGKKRFVTVADFLPIVAGHRGIPVEVALNAPSFTVGLLPLFAWIDLHLETGKIDFAFADFLAGGGVDHTNDGPGFVEDFLAFLVQVVAFDTGEEFFVFALLQVVHVKHTLRRAILLRPERA